ncbi:hypothetical protein ACH4UT_28720 [Streptomyces sp. NPDC020799]|uniref:hypothetical protein n=1 Tax=Streptomyces sp. NPDC020799 TaxID=3365091 RepID=UPI0037B67116
MSQHHLAERPRLAEPLPAPAPGRAAARRARAHHAREGSLPGRYLGYVGYFVGAGLISGAVVHYPLDPARYTRIAGYGVLVFLAATVLNEFVLKRERPALPRMLLVIGASLMLSFGIGMLSGGLQHFDDFPDRAAMLVPMGMAVSFVAYVLKEAEKPWRRIFSVFGLGVLVAALITFAGLRELAADIITERPAGSGGHSHGAEEPADKNEHSEEEAPAAPTSGGPSAPPAPAKQEQPHKDGHSH